MSWLDVAKKSVEKKQTNPTAADRTCPGKILENTLEKMLTKYGPLCKEIHTSTVDGTTFAEKRLNNFELDFESYEALRKREGCIYATPLPREKVVRVLHNNSVVLLECNRSIVILDDVVLFSEEGGSYSISGNFDALIGKELGCISEDSSSVPDEQHQKLVEDTCSQECVDDEFGEFLIHHSASFTVHCLDGTVLTFKVSKYHTGYDFAHYRVRCCDKIEK